ncbi:MAG TPA: GNAT family N-acetyltransferase, partial [Bacteroidia bacterium]|nr:GNAT family N-acetyltransferase [Bacteroidia bacterium]
AWNHHHVPQRMKPQRLDFTARDGQGKIIGGIIAEIGYWGGTDIHVLWVDEQSRSKGTGTMLVKKVEEETRKLGGTIVRTDTFEFLARDFFIKLGYTVFGELHGFPEAGNTRYYFSKFLR